MDTAPHTARQLPAEPRARGQVCLSPPPLPTWDTRPAVLGWSPERTRQLLHCLQPPVHRGKSLLQEMEKAPSSCWAVLMTSNGGLTEELGCDTAHWRANQPHQCMTSVQHHGGSPQGPQQGHSTVTCAWIAR